MDKIRMSIKMKKGDNGMKNNIMFIIIIIVGTLLGAFIGDILGKYETWAWLGYGKEIGISEPLVLDMYVLRFSFGLVVKLNVASILGFILAIVGYKKFM